MDKLVIVKYHGIKIGVNEDGTPRILQKYDAGSALCLFVGQVSSPISYAEAQRLKTDFGDAFEIIHEVDIPETPEEATAIENMTVTGNDGKFVTFTQPDEDDNEIIIKRKAKTKFDKTEKPLEQKDVEYPDKLSKTKMGTMKKAELKRIYLAWYKASGTGGLKLDRKATKADYIAEILIYQMAV